MENNNFEEFLAQFKARHPSWFGVAPMMTPAKKQAVAVQPSEPRKSPDWWEQNDYDREEMNGIQEA